MYFTETVILRKNKVSESIVVWKSFEILILYLTITNSTWRIGKILRLAFFSKIPVHFEILALWYL